MDKPPIDRWKAANKGSSSKASEQLELKFYQPTTPSRVQRAGTASQESPEQSQVQASAALVPSGLSFSPSNPYATIQGSDASTHSIFPYDSNIPYAGSIVPPTGSFFITNQRGNGFSQTSAGPSSGASNPPHFDQIAPLTTMDAGLVRQGQVVPSFAGHQSNQTLPPPTVPQDQIATSSAGLQSNQTLLPPPGMIFKIPFDFRFPPQHDLEQRDLARLQRDTLPFLLHSLRTTFQTDGEGLGFIQVLDPPALNPNRPMLDKQFITDFNDVGVLISQSYRRFTQIGQRVRDVFHPGTTAHQQWTWTSLRTQVYNLLQLEHNSIISDFELLRRFEDGKNQVCALKHICEFIEVEVIGSQNYDWLHCFCMVLSTGWAARLRIVFDRYFYLWTILKDTLARGLEQDQAWRTLKELEDEMTRVGDHDPSNANATDSSSRIKIKNLGLLHMIIDLLSCRPKEFSQCPRYDLLENARKGGRVCDLVHDMGMKMYRKYVRPKEEIDFEHELRQYFPRLTTLQNYITRSSDYSPKADSRAHINRDRNAQRAGNQRQDIQLNAAISQQMSANPQQIAIAHHHIPNAHSNTMTNQTANGNQNVNGNPTVNFQTVTGNHPTNCNNNAIGNHNTSNYNANFYQTSSKQNTPGNQTVHGNNTNGNHNAASTYTTNSNQASNNQIANGNQFASGSQTTNYQQYYQ